MQVATRVEGAQLELLVLAAGRCGLAGVDLTSGAMVRASWPETGAVPLAPYDVVRVELGRESPDTPPFAPEAVHLAAPPTPVGALHGRRAERYVRALVHPRGRPLLGFPAPAVPFWELRGDRPSLAIVEPERGPLVVRDGERMRCRFRWQRHDHDLPLDDLRVRALLDHPAAMRIGGRTLRRALGWEPRRLLVALSAPHRGHCYKVVVGLLPRA